MTFSHRLTRPILPFALSLLALPLAAQEGPREIAPQDLPAALAALAPQIAFLGEVHDNPDHHANQAAIVAALAPRALVFEMFGEDQAKAAKDLARDDPGALGAALGWADSGWPDFALYAPIFAAAPQAALYGAALPRPEIRRILADPGGGVAGFGEDAARFGLTQALPPVQQQQREAEQARAHCNALPQDLLPQMVTAQRLRDAALARAALRALAETGGPVVVIAGSGHTRRDWGAPALLARAAPDVALTSLGQGETGSASEPGSYDIIARAPAPEGRGDPCAGLSSGG